MQWKQKISGVLFVGDLTDSGTEAQYDTLMSTINNSPMAGKVYLSMGNHDHYTGDTARFEEKTGQKASEVLNFNGVTVVKLNPSINGNNYTNDYDLLKGALEDANTADPTAPVIIIGHHGVKDTAYVTNEWYGSYGEGTDKDMVALMEQYPQAIHISGHSHSTLEDARSIYQDDGFTAIQDSTIGAYFENESGKVDPTTGKGSTYPDDPNYSSQALRIDVLSDNTVKIYRMDLTEGGQTVRKVFADYYKEPRKTDWSVKVADLTGETTYSVAVTAVTSFGAASEPITAAEDVTTGAGYKPVYPAEAILDVDFSRDATGESGKAAVKLTGVQVAGYDESGEAVFLDSTIAGGEAVTAIGSKYDVNTDGVVDLRDIVHAQKFYQLTANWEQAKNCDVNADGMIDLEDLIAILRAYAA